MVTSQVRRITPIALLSAGLWHCHQPSASSTESLDNVANQSAAATVNRCGATDSSPLPAEIKSLASRISTDAGDSASLDAALSVLRVVPKSLRDTFVALGGTFDLTSNAMVACAKVALSPMAQRLVNAPNASTSCWTASGTGGAPVIHVAPGEISIRHSLLRAMAYVFTEYLLPRVGIATAPAPFNDANWVKEASAFRAESLSLATAFLSDVKSVAPDAYEPLAAAQKTAPSEFANLIYAESLDSYYCSAPSRTVFASKFATTYRVFTDVSVANSPVNQFGSR